LKERRREEKEEEEEQEEEEQEEQEEATTAAISQSSSSSFFLNSHTWAIMLAAVQSGDAEELAELVGQDPGFDVNMEVDGLGSTLLHYACLDSSSSPVIPLLLAHPDIDVNVKDSYGWTPFFYACCGRPSSVRLLLKDPRVKLNEPNNDGHTPLWIAARRCHIDVIKWWIASGGEMDLGEPGHEKTDAILGAKDNDKTEVATLLERFKENPGLTRHAMRVKLGLLDELAAEVFALVVFVSDGLLQIKDPTTTTPAARFFNIAKRLPLELQMVPSPGGIRQGDRPRQRERVGIQGTGQEAHVVLHLHQLAPHPTLPLLCGCVVFSTFVSSELWKNESFVLPSFRSVVVHRVSERASRETDIKLPRMKL